MQINPPDMLHLHESMTVLVLSYLQGSVVLEGLLRLDPGLPGSILW